MVIYKIKYLNLKENNIIINKVNPIIKYKNNKIDLINNYYILNNTDSYSDSSINKDTLESDWEYCKKIFEIIKNNHTRNNILCLGFGIGSIPLQLLKLNNINNIDCVDIDSSLFKIHLKLFGSNNKIKLYHNDANKYLKNSSEKYDVIIDDVFMKDNKLYLNYQKCYELLNDNGILIINEFDENKQIEYKLKKIFKSVEYYKADENFIILCKK